MDSDAGAAKPIVRAQSTLEAISQIDQVDIRWIGSAGSCLQSLDIREIDPQSRTDERASPRSGSDGRKRTTGAPSLRPVNSR